jgi:hypothetical protein
MNIFSYGCYRRTDGIPLGKALDETSLILKPFVDDKSSTDCFQIILGTVLFGNLFLFVIV